MSYPKLSQIQLDAIKVASALVFPDALAFLKQIVSVDTTNPPGRKFVNCVVMLYYLKLDPPTG